MSTKPVKSRIHLLAARKAPTIVILQRKRAKLFHVITVDTQTLRVRQGSWFRGRLYVMRCDVSFDGQFMVYLATGKAYKSWSGLCRLPWLTTLVHVEGVGANWGGGYFRSARVLATNYWDLETVSVAAEIPFKLALGPVTGFTSGDLGILYRRFARDGFRRLGDRWGKEESSPTLSRHLHRGRRRGTSPRAYIRSRGALPRLHPFRAPFAFSLAEHPAVLAGQAGRPGTRTATCGSPSGAVERSRWRPAARHPSFALDVDRFEPPARAAKLLGSRFSSAQTPHTPAPPPRCISRRSGEIR